MDPEKAVSPVSFPHLFDGVLTLRALGMKDVETVLAWADDPQVVRWTRIPQPYTRADARSVVIRSSQGWASGELYRFGIECGGELVGDVQLRVHPAGRADLGFGLAATHRGRGLTTRALRLVLPWAFNEAGLQVVHWRAMVGNWASRRVAWAVGFDVLDQPMPGLTDQRGTLVDCWLGALRAGDELHPRRPWFDPARIVGPTLTLRAYREADVPRVVEACRDRLTQHWIRALPERYSQTTAREHLTEVQDLQAAGRGVVWAVADPDDDRLLAEIGIFVRDLRAGVAEIGYWAHPDARGRGVTTEAVRLAARHALIPVEDGGLGFTHLLLRAAQNNQASQRVALKAGFTPSGRDRETDLRRDQTRVDHLRFDLLARELPAGR